MEQGHYDKAVVIEVKTVERGASGGIVETWEAFTPTIHARIRHRSGNERQATKVAGGEVAQSYTEIGIWYRPGIEALTMRVIHRGVAYNIRHVNNQQEANRELLLTCETGVNRG